MADYSSRAFSKGLVLAEYYCHLRGHLVGVLEWLKPGALKKVLMIVHVNMQFAAPFIRALKDTAHFSSMING